MTLGCVSFLHKMFLTEHTPNHTSCRRCHKLEWQYSHLPFCIFLCRSNAAAAFHEEQIFGMILQIYMIHFHTSPTEIQSVDELLGSKYFCNNIWYITFISFTQSLKCRRKFLSIKLTSFASTRRNLCFIWTYITFVSFDSRFTYTFSWHLFTVVSHWSVRRTLKCLKRKKRTLTFALDFWNLMIIRR